MANDIAVKMENNSVLTTDNNNSNSSGNNSNNNVNSNLNNLPLKMEAVKIENKNENKTVKNRKRKNDDEPAKKQINKKPKKSNDDDDQKCSASASSKKGKCYIDPDEEKDLYSDSELDNIDDVELDSELDEAFEDDEEEEEEVEEGAEVLNDEPAADAVELTTEEDEARERKRMDEFMNRKYKGKSRMETSEDFLNDLALRYCKKREIKVINKRFKREAKESGKTFKLIKETSDEENDDGNERISKLKQKLLSSRN
jgi:hypothetical protein